MELDGVHTASWDESGDVDQGVWARGVPSGPREQCHAVQGVSGEGVRQEHRTSKGGND